MLPDDFISKLPFTSFKWKWGCVQCTEGINDPVVLLGVLFRMRKLENRYKYSSEEFLKELINLENDIKDSITINLSRNGERNIIRNSGQYWKALGLIPKEKTGGIITLTPFGRAIADKKITQNEFVALTIQTFTLPNNTIQSEKEIELWNNHNIRIQPLKLILQVIRELNHISEDDGYITCDELKKVIIPLSAYTKDINDYVKFILKFRNGDTLDNWDNFCVKSNDGRIAREYLLFLANYGYLRKEHNSHNSDEKYKYIYSLDDEITEIITNEVTYNSLLEGVPSIRDVASQVGKKKVSSSVKRPHQAKFRKEVLTACKRCIITNATMPEILEAAHIKPFKYNGDNTVENGFAMRTDIHVLYDTDNLRINENGDVLLSDRARMDYGSIIPPKIIIPDFINLENIRWRWNNYDGL